MFLAYQISGPGIAFPLVFWWQAGVGNGALAISGWVWSLRPGDLAARLFFVSGIATFFFTLSPAYASIDNVAYIDGLRTTISLLNGGGASLFGMSMIALFLVYPVKLPHWRFWALTAFAFFGLATIFVLRGSIIPFASMDAVTLSEMLVIFAALIAQYVLSRGDPKARAVLIWLGGAVIIGAGAFISLVSAPRTLGFPPILDPRLAFGFFLIIYIGCAAGLVRYRLFELGEWAYRALFYVLAAALLLVLDAFLILTLPLDPGPALAVSVIILSLVYLPFRDRIGRMLLRRGNLDDQQLFREVTHTAFAPKGRRAEQWQRSLATVFKPLEIVEIENAGSDPVIRDEGLALYMPKLAEGSALELRYPWNGQGLFGPAQVRTARLLVDLMQRAEESRAAYERGASEERSRIAQDMHDNIGAQLMGALHSRDARRKDAMIRESLTDLRNIINNTPAEGGQLADVLADLRAETSERMAAADIQLDWPVDLEACATLSPEAGHALRSLIREAVSNTIRHSRAQSFAFALTATDGRIDIVVIDDGVGFDPGKSHAGHGLEHMQNRARALGGDIQIQSDKGTRITMSLPGLTGEG